MTSTTPLVFRPSPGQRGMAALLFVGSWLVGVRGVAALVHVLPRLKWALKAAEAAGEPTGWLWVQTLAAVAACVGGGLVLAASLLALLMVEGSHVMTDELGISVEHSALPGPMARWLGAGRLTWKRVSGLDRKGPFFVVRGGGEADGSSVLGDPELKFLLVEDLERLVLLILERSPNLRFRE